MFVYLVFLFGFSTGNRLGQGWWGKVSCSPQLPEDSAGEGREGAQWGVCLQIAVDGHRTQQNEQENLEMLFIKYFK